MNMDLLVLRKVLLGALENQFPIEVFAKRRVRGFVNSVSHAVVVLRDGRSGELYTSPLANIDRVMRIRGGRPLWSATSARGVA